VDVPKKNHRERDRLRSTPAHPQAPTGASPSTARPKRRRADQQFPPGAYPGPTVQGQAYCQPSLADDTEVAEQQRLYSLVHKQGLNAARLEVCRAALVETSPAPPPRTVGVWLMGACA